MVYTKIFILTFIISIIQGVLSSKLLDNRVSCADTKLIVDLHNEMRTRVAKGILPGQPKASNMMKLAWDDRLADLAQSWANNMKFKHNEGRRDGRFEHVGENLYTSWSTSSNREPEWKRALDEWFDEHEIYTYKPLKNNPKTGHYTQMVWADTMYVGCGFALYKKDKYLHKLYVCNYGPGGNILKRFPYKKGAGCENLCCKSQCDRLYGNKC